MADTDLNDPQESAEPRAAKGRGHGAKSPEVRARAVTALLSENSIGAAAERCGLNEKTLRVWLTEDTFKQQLDAARREMFAAAMDRLQPLAAQAVDTLQALMAESVPPSVRLGAARTLVEVSINRDDAQVILGKLADIEALQRRSDGEER
jgi:hypothetical protein